MRVEPRVGSASGLPRMVLITPKGSDLGDTAPSSVMRRTRTLLTLPGKTAEVSQVRVWSNPGRTPAISPLVLESGIQVVPPSRLYSRAMVWVTPTTPVRSNVMRAEPTLGSTSGFPIRVLPAEKGLDGGEMAPSSVLNRTRTLF